MSIEIDYLDPDWIELIEEAFYVGLTAEEIRVFLQQNEKLAST